MPKEKHWALWGLKKKRKEPEGSKDDRSDKTKTTSESCKHLPLFAASVYTSNLTSPPELATLRPTDA
ncbi:hypothetical protein Baya_10439 [Bagarius yarrelli]|uniref:Uncharacterized protein n=1 Tax=Bagarius yarrelli TaxID=175774 RepID=A0A556UF79_BAGYA|nr:hypothetical protein Baya_10439 [Bagarius yarrelli]